MARELTVQALHDRAMRAADRAIAARRAGAVVAEHNQIRRALNLELRAAGLAAERQASVATLAILTDSAHALKNRMIELQTGPSRTLPAHATPRRTE